MTFSTEKTGTWGMGSPAGMAPKRVPIVAMSSFASVVTRAASTTAIRMPGQPGRYRFSVKMIAIVPAAMAKAYQSALGAAAARTVSFSRKGPGSGTASVRPNRSFSWLEPMMMAMPAVKPTVTG
jgi:hypothetical protein